LGCDKATELDQLRILPQNAEFDAAFADPNWHLRTGDMNKKEMYAKQHPMFLEALLREHCGDVTSRVIKALEQRSSQSSETTS
jgi:hypothetical protein